MFLAMSTVFPGDIGIAFFRVFRTHFSKPSKGSSREFDEFIELLAQEHGIAVKQGEEWK